MSRIGVPKKLRWFLEYILVLLMQAVAIVSPRKVLRHIGSALGLVSHTVFVNRRRIALRNTRLVYGTERPDIVRGSFASMGITIMEMLRFLGGRDDVLENVRIDGLEHVFHARASGRPTMVITAHLGNWELFANAAARDGVLNGLVARPLDNPFLNAMSDRIRKRYGNSVVYKRGALKGTLQCLHGFRNVVIMIDQGVRRPEGVITDFMGRRAYTTKMPALLALKTGAAVFPGTIRRTPGGHLAVIGPELPISRTGQMENDIEVNTMRFSREIAARVFQVPDEWLWIHNRWKRIPENDEVP